MREIVDQVAGAETLYSAVAMMKLLHANESKPADSHWNQIESNEIPNRTRSGQTERIDRSCGASRGPPLDWITQLDCVALQERDPKPMKGTRV